MHFELWTLDCSCNCSSWKLTLLVALRSSVVGTSRRLSSPNVEPQETRWVRSFDEALEGAGVGAYHVILLLVAGWALASDSVEVQCISFVTPELDHPGQLNPSKVTSHAELGGGDNSIDNL